MVCVIPTGFTPSSSLLASTHVKIREPRTNVHTIVRCPVTRSTNGEENSEPLFTYACVSRCQCKNAASKFVVTFFFLKGGHIGSIRHLKMTVCAVAMFKKKVFTSFLIHVCCL